MKNTSKFIFIAIVVLSIVMLTLVSCDFDLSKIFGEYVCIHEWSKWDIVEQGNCQNPGIIKRECTKCGAIDEETTALKDHTEGGWIVDKEANCTEEGLMHKECIICRVTISEKEIPITKHNYENYNCIYCGLTNEDCFEFTYLSDSDSYAIKAKSKDNLPNEISLPSSFNGKLVTSIGDDAFFGCSSLTSVVIPDSVTSIGYEAFYSCDSLASVVIGDSVTSIGDYAFSNTAYYKNENNWVDGVLYIGNHLIEAKTTVSGEYVIKEGTITIGNWAFAYCYSLTSVVIPDGVTSIGFRAFTGCSSLTSVVIPDSVTSIGYETFYNTVYYNNENNWVDGVLYIGNHLIEAKTTVSGEYVIKEGTITIGNWAFAYCDSLTSVTIPDSVTSIGSYAFAHCDSLTSVTIPDSVTSIGSYAFYGCVSLTSVVIPDSITSIGSSAFEDCSSLTSVTIPDSVTSIGSYAFYGCVSLTSVVISDSVTSIGSYAFAYCILDTIVCNSPNYHVEGGCLIEGTKVIAGTNNSVIPEGITAIDDYAFYGRDKLTNIVIPDSVTSIGAWAFDYCFSLVSVVIPDSVTSIGNRAFYGCVSLTEVYYNGTAAEWNSISISYNNDRLENATRYYYSETEPTEEGNFWHWGENGEVVVWE